MNREQSFGPAMRKTRSQTQAEVQRRQSIKEEEQTIQNYDNLGCVILKDDREQEMVIPRVPMNVDELGNLKIGEILNDLVEKRQLQTLANSVVSYYSNSQDCFIYCATGPFSRLTKIPALEFPVEDGKLVLRYREKVQPLSQGSDLFLVDTTNHNTISKGSRRTKERKIGQIIQKVADWRAYYTGQKRFDGQKYEKISLEDAAQRVGISKKSLDDYLLQIRFGRKYGFNFNEHKDDKVGILRSFVRKEKELERARVKGIGKRMSSRMSSTYSNINSNRLKRIRCRVKGLNSFPNLKMNTTFEVKIKI